MAKVMNIVFLGPPGAGKGTQAEMVATGHGIPHIATGVMMRQAIESGTELGAKVKSYLDAGNLVPDDLTIEVVKDRLSHDDCKGGYVLDGYPRTIPQAEQFLNYLSEAGVTPIVLELVVPEEELLKRIALRSEGRSDDSAEVARHRLSVYTELTAPVADFFRKNQDVVRVDGVGSVEEVRNRVQAGLEG